jgi:hypothetical protein
MKTSQSFDGVEQIDPDGSVHFTEIARTIMQRELGFGLPKTVNTADLKEVALAQISAVQRRFQG